MKDEIKEILDKLKSTANSKMDFTYTIIQKLEAKSLLDYITNLEKCYCNKTDCSARIKDSKKYDSLLQENEKLQEENERLKKDYGRLMQDNAYTLELERRNGKATEYMNNYIEVEDAPINERIKIEFKEVIRLLTGGGE